MYVWMHICMCIYMPRERERERGREKEREGERGKRKRERIINQETRSGYIVRPILNQTKQNIK